MNMRRHVLRDSSPGGMCAESISYSGFFFHVADLADVFVADERTRQIDDGPIETHEAVKPLDEVEFRPVRPDIDQGAL